MANERGATTAGGYREPDIDELLGFENHATRGDREQVMENNKPAGSRGGVNNPAAGHRVKQRRVHKALSRLSCLFCVVGVKPKDDYLLNGSTMDLDEENAGRRKKHVSTPSNSSNGSQAKGGQNSPTGVDDFDANPDQILSPREYHEPFDAATFEWKSVLHYERGETSVPQDIFCGSVGDSSDDSSGCNSKVERLLWMKSPQSPGYYSGPVVRGGVPNGKGELEFENGDLYQGLFKNGHMHDEKGVYKWQSGAVYVGGFSEGLREGHGEHSVGGTLRYVGCFEQGIPHGYGEGYRADGGLFHKGQWERGMPAHAMLDLVEPTSTLLDDDTQINELIMAACDLSILSSVADPQISRYDPYRRMLGTSSIGSSLDSSSIDSDRESCFSEITTDAALSSESESEARSRSKKSKETSVYDAPDESFLSLEPRSPLTANKLRHHNLAVIQATRILAGQTERLSPRGADALSPSNLYGPRVEI